MIDSLCVRRDKIMISAKTDLLNQINSYLENFDDLQSFVEEYLEEVRGFPEEVQNYFHNYSYFDLSGGLIGNSLLLSEMDNLCPEKNYSKKIFEILKVGLNRSNLLNLDSPSLWSGLTGICIILRAASPDGIRYKNVLNSCEEILATLIETKLIEVNRNLNNDDVQMNDYDVIEGLAGVAPYVINSSDNPVFTNEIKDGIIDYLIEISKSTSNSEGILIPNWRIKSENQFLSEEKEHFLYGNLNLGHSHGISGVLNSLIFISENNEVVFNKTKNTIDQLSKWLIKYNYSDGTHVFWDKKMPMENYIEFNKSTTQDKINFSWCYGELMIALAIWSSGKLLNNELYKEFAHDRFLEYIPTIEKETLNSPSFCHGYAGLLYMLSEIKRRTESDFFGKTEKNIYSKLMKQLSQENKFDFQDVEIYNHFKYEFNKTGILTGTSGIYLVLLNYEDKLSSNLLRNLFIF